MNDFNLELLTNTELCYKETLKWCLLKVDIHGIINKEAYDRSGNILDGYCSVWTMPDVPRKNWMYFDKLSFICQLLIGESLVRQGYKPKINERRYFGCEKDYVGKDAQCVTKEDVWNEFLRRKPECDIRYNTI